MANDSLTELEERVLAGDTTITAAALAKAREAARLAELRAEADRRAVLAEDEANAAADRDGVRRELIEPLDARARALQPAYEDAVSALRRLHDGINELNAERDNVLREARRVGLEATVPEPIKGIDLIVNSVVADAKGEPLTRPPIDRGPRRVAAHALHSDSYVAEMNERLALEFTERAGLREQRREQAKVRRAAEEAARDERRQLAAERARRLSGVEYVQV